MNENQQVDGIKCNIKTNTYITMRATWPLLPTIAVLFLGCAASPPRDARAPSAVGNLANIHAGGSSAPKIRLALVALPDRIYEIPMSVSVRTAIGPSVIAAASAPARDAGSRPAAPGSSVNTALAHSAPVVFAAVEPTPVLTATTFSLQDNAAAQPALMAVLLHLPALSAMPAPALTPEKQTVNPPPTVAQVVAPKLKLDSDFESVKHAVRFAFDRSVVGPQAQALMAKILRDAKAATRIKLTGFSDGIGTRLANERVATARALSIRDELVRNDVDPGKILVEPAVIMSPPKTRQPSWYYAEHRRVEVDITKPKLPLMLSLNDPTIAK